MGIMLENFKMAERLDTGVKKGVGGNVFKKVKFLKRFILVPS